VRRSFVPVSRARQAVLAPPGRDAMIMAEMRPVVEAGHCDSTPRRQRMARGSLAEKDLLHVWIWAGRRLCLVGGCAGGGIWTWTRRCCSGAVAQLWSPTPWQETSRRRTLYLRELYNSDSPGFQSIARTRTRNMYEFVSTPLWPYW